MRQAIYGSLSGTLTFVAMMGCDAPGPLAPRAHLSVAETATASAARATALNGGSCALDAGGFTLRSENDYFPIGVGSQSLLQGEEDGERIELRITVLDATEVVGGVTTRVIEEREFKDGVLFEVSRNYYASAKDGTVCYFGEAVDFYENGQIVSHEGSWRADAAGNAPGIIMPADPRPGMKFQMENAPGIAEDAGEVLGTGPVRVPAGAFRETIRVRETNPLDGGVGYKIFAEDVGLVVDGPVRLVRYRVRGDDE